MRSKIIINISACLLAVFAFITFVVSGLVLFDLFGFQAKEGHFVFSVVFFNFICSFIYIYSAFAILAKSKWTTIVLFIAFILQIISALLFYFHIKSGGLFEQKSIYAMTFRVSLALILPIISWFYFPKK